MKAKRLELNAENIGKAVKAGASSLTQVWRVLGGAGNVAGSTAARMRELVPGIDDCLAANRDAKAGSDKTGVKAKPIAASGGRWPRDPRNVFRAGSSYGAAFDILAHSEGLRKDKWIELLAAATGKSLARSAFDCQVLMSARPNDQPGLSNNDSQRHRSCRPGFYIVRNGDLLTLKVD